MYKLFIHQTIIRNSFIIYNLLRNYSKNHYEVLKLKRNCSYKEIKEAYIKLTKEYHPDCTKNKELHKKFVEVVEAYNILSKPRSRKSYDLCMAPYTSPVSTTKNQQQEYETPKRDPWEDPLFWNNRDRKFDEFYRGQPYYGIPGLKKVPNAMIVIFCVCVAVLGVGLQILAVRRIFRNALTLPREKMMQRSKEIEQQLEKKRQEAEAIGNEGQLELLKYRLNEEAKKRN